jgi:hypothetical protein
VFFTLCVASFLEIMAHDRSGWYAACDGLEPGASKRRHRAGEYRWSELVVFRCAVVAVDHGSGSHNTQRESRSSRINRALSEDDRRLSRRVHR